MDFKKMFIFFVGTLTLICTILFVGVKPTLANFECWPGQQAFSDAQDECDEYCWLTYQEACADPLPLDSWCNMDTCVTKWDLVCEGHESESHHWYTYESNHPSCGD